MNDSGHESGRLRARVWTVASALVLLVGASVQAIWPAAPAATLALFPIAVLAAALSRVRATLLRVTVASLTALPAIALWQVYGPAARAFVTAALDASVMMVLVIGVTAVARRMNRDTARYGLLQADVRQARARLDRSERLMGMAQRVGRFGGWSVDMRSRQVLWSPEVAAIHEAPPDYAPSLDEAIGFYAPEYRARVAEAAQRCATQGIGFDEEWLLTTATGREVWVRSIGEPVRDGDGRIVEIQGAFQDIDARRRMEESLHASQRRFQRFVDSMPLMVWTADVDGRMDFLNRFGMEYVGAGDSGMLQGDGWLPAVHPDDRASTVAAWTASLRSGEPYVHEFRLQRRDGCYRWHLTRAVPVREGGEAISSWFGTCIDIEERRMLAERYERTLESITDAFFSLDREWRFSYLNGQFERQAGAPASRLLGQSIWEVYPQLVDTKFHRCCLRAAETAEAVHFQECMPGTGRWYDVSVYPSDDGVAAYLRDITQEREVERQLQLAQRMESLGELTGGVAHDFNNLLTVIVGNAGLLSDKLKGEPRLHRMAGLIGEAAQRGADLTQRLLAFARKQPLEPQSTDCAKLIDDMRGLLASALDESVRLEFSFGPSLWPALVDPGQLESALLNLCLNSRAAMPDGGRVVIEIDNLSVSERTESVPADVPAGDYVRLRVSDTGGGIDAEHIAHVFDPFFTTRKKGKGTGLGLAMVYGFARQSGGGVDLQSTVGHGTTVTLMLPRAHTPPVQVSRAEPVRAGRRATVLAVEDDELVRTHVADQLTALGHHVLTADSASAALDVLRARDDVELLFTDVIMPGGMNGRELAVHATALRPRLRVLYTSGYTQDELLEQGRLAPGVQLLSKPYRQETLARYVRQALGEHQPPVDQVER